MMALEPIRSARIPWGVRMGALMVAVAWGGVAPACVLERTYLWSTSYADGRPCQVGYSEVRGGVSNLIVKEYTTNHVLYYESTLGARGREVVTRVTGYYENGRVRESGLIVQRPGLETKSFRNWNERGELEASSVSTNGAPMAFTLHPALKIHRHPSDAHTLTFRSGRPREIFLTDGGKLQGLWRSYWENGELQSKLYLEQGRVVGPQAYYYYTGALKSMEDVSGGNGVIDQYDPAGFLKERTVVSNGLPKFKINYFDEGETNAFQEFSLGFLVKRWRCKYPGRMRYESIITNGMILGERLVPEP